MIEKGARAVAFYSRDIGLRVLLISGMGSFHCPSFVVVFAQKRGLCQKFTIEISVLVSCKLKKIIKNTIL
jgi:hypothetical protein